MVGAKSQTQDQGQKFSAKIFNKPKMVLLFCSTPRSGSSFIGELLSTVNSSVLFFEPNHKIEQEPCLTSESCLSKYLTDKFLCRLDDDFTWWLKHKQLFLGFFNEKTMKWFNMVEPQERTKLFESMDIAKECLDSHVRLVKIVRGRLNLLESLLSNLSLDMKIIHLYRDPRGFMRSISTMTSWNHEPSHFCSGLEQDFISFRNLEKKYPGKIMQLSYERFSLNPLENTKALFEFAFENNTLSNKTLNYIESHTKHYYKTDAMSRVKKSDEVYQSWRNTITEVLLKNVESESSCKASIEMMGHKLYKSLSNAKNLTLPLFL